MADPVDEAMREVEAYCESRVPQDLQDELRIECTRRGSSITILERRPPWKPDLSAQWSEIKVAQLRYEESAGTWSLHCSDSGGRWHLFDDVRPSRTVEPLLAVVEADPTGIFWG
jgi:hypothetical protein